MNTLWTRSWTVAALLAGALLQACAPTPDCCSGGAPAGELSGLSIYQVAHEFRDQEGTVRRLVDFRGTPVLMAMIFTKCSYACPAIIADVKRIVASEGVPEALQVVYVSMDAERDHPEVLAAFAREHALSPSRYTLLHGEADAVAELAAVLGVRYAKVEGGQFSHSNLITLLDSGGQVHFRHEGLAADPSPLLASVSTLVSAR